MAQTAWPASEKQLGFISKLMQDRVVPEGFELDNPTSKEASAAIDSLMKQPYKYAKPAVDFSAIELGYYIVGEVIYVVVENHAKTRRYAKKLVKRYGNSKWTWGYAAGAMSLLAGKSSITMQEAAQFGHLHGHCFKCGLELTDPKSVELGIGPVCIKKMGW